MLLRELRMPSAKVFFVVALLLIFSGLGFVHWLNRPLSISSEGAELVVSRGDSMTKVAAELEARGILDFPLLLRIYSRVLGRDNDLRPGEYMLKASISAHQLLKLLVSGKVRTYSVTFPEGITLSQALSLLHHQPKLQKELFGAELDELAGLIEENNPEGWFFPDTYIYTAGTSDRELLIQAHRKMRSVLDEEWHNRRSKLPYKNAYEALIMASIVEKETGLASERALIAGVFISRLKKGMRLQTDPTIIYGLGDKFDGNITRKHLRDDANPYNTYYIKGLPPSPIALPGRESIRAALQPASTTALYFVARGDGSHYFSETLEEHLEAVRRYQLKQS